MSEVIYNQSGDSLYDDDFHDTLVRISRMLWYLLYYSYTTRLHHYLSYFTILWFVVRISNLTRVSLILLLYYPLILLSLVIHDTLVRMGTVVSFIFSHR